MDTTPHTGNPSVAVVTGASRGLGAAIAAELAERGWRLLLDARGEPDLTAVAARLSEHTTVVALPGDVSDGEHRAALAAAAEGLGGARLLVNNASALGGSPMPRIAEFPLPALLDVFEVNVLGPLALTQLLLPQLRAVGDGAAVVNISSDAAVEPYDGWGGYGPSKAALDHASAILAAEEPSLSVWAVDPGDLRTRMHAEAFPWQDISDLPEPESVVPALLRLLDERPPSGRYRAEELLAGLVAGGAS